MLTGSNCLPHNPALVFVCKSLLQGITQLSKGFLTIPRQGRFSKSSAKAVRVRYFSGVVSNRFPLYPGSNLYPRSQNYEMRSGCVDLIRLESEFVQRY